MAIALRSGCISSLPVRDINNKVSNLLFYPKAMNQNACVFQLKVQRVEQVCLFELSWGRGQQLGVTLPYPETLSILYQDWSANYLSFYKTALRGRVAATGNIAPPPVDWHSQLVQAEAKLLYEFHHWLRSAQLYEIRSHIAQALRDGEIVQSPITTIDVFLTCNSLEIARLPWEAWEIGREFAATGRIRFVRTPMNIQGVTLPPQNRRRARVLAILGDDTGLNFQADKDAVRSLSSIAEVEFVGWQPGQDINALKTKIVKVIADQQGWDVLFFAGHSNETVLTGGELAIAPGVSLNLSEIARPLTIAKERGLQFALFNSCNGLTLANALIDLGLSQVAVMREPIHNRVAQEFLVRFLQRLAAYKDVHEALLAACEYLKLEKHLTYPSAYLIPSLFRHPDAPLFRIEFFGLKQQLKCWLPTRREALALAALTLISWQLSVQNFLLERRVLTQAMYRQLTGQVDKTLPPLLLIQIDDQSIVEAGIKDPTPMDRSYLSKLVDKLSTLKAKVVGIDYLLDRPHGESDRILSQSLQKAVQQQQTWFVFAATTDDTAKWVGVFPKIASIDWTLQGDMNLFNWQGKLGYMTLVPPKDASSRNLPLAYLLALANQLNFQPAYSPPQPQLHSPTNNFLSQLTDYLENTHRKNYTTLFSPSSRLNPITNFAYGLNQMWLHPIIDFSIPPEQVYQRIPAWKFLQMNSHQLLSLNQKVVMIAPGGYGDDPGVQAGSEDIFPVPAAVSYWRSQQNLLDPRRIFTGGEAHAYVFHNFLAKRLVIPIPDLWMIGVAALLGKATTLALQQRQQQLRQWGVVLLITVPTAYGLTSLQIYIWAAILLPCFLPSVTFWTYILPLLIRKKHHA